MAVMIRRTRAAGVTVVIIEHTRGDVARQRASSMSRSSRVVSPAGRTPACSTRLTRPSAACERSRAAPGASPWAKAPTMTFSSTVRCGKTRTTWKVRPMPRRQTRWGRRPVIGAPSQRTRPRSGSRKPLSTLKSVVLPAPFGPMIPTPPWATACPASRAWSTAPPSWLVAQVVHDYSKDERIRQRGQAEVDAGQPEGRRADERAASTATPTPAHMPSHGVSWSLAASSTVT
jgi:hypothetical protein